MSPHVKEALCSLRKDFAHRMPLWFLASAAFTASIIQYSFRRGRLLFYPTFDDVSYLLDALRRIESVYQRSPTVFFSDWMRDPPHAPFSTMLAFLSFLLLGVHDWAPYAANVVIVLAFVIFSDRLMPDTPALCRWGAIVFVLSTPLAADAVYEFRPDVACALLTTMGIFILLDSRLAGSSKIRPALGGTFFGLALLAKPTVFPMTIAVSMWALGCAIARDALIGRSTFQRRAVLRSIALFVVPAIIIAGPHYLVGAKPLLEYIYDAQYASADVWALKGVPRWQHIMFYLSGPGAQMVLRRHRFLMLVIFIAWGLHLWFARKRDEIADAIAYAAVIFVAYLGPTLNWQKTQYLGLVFHVSLVFFSVLILHHLVELERERGWKIPWARVLIISTAILGMLFFQWPASRSPEEIARAGDGRQITDRILDAIVHSSGSSASTTVVTTSGYVSSSLFNYLALERRLPLAFVGLGASGDLEQLRNAWSKGDFVVAGERDNSETDTFLRSYAIQDQVLAELRARPDFVEIAAVSTLNAKRFFVFQNISRRPRR